MGKLENIKKLIKEGKGNLKMIEFLLWYVESLSDQSKAEELYRRTASDGGKMEFLGLIMRIEAQRKRVDNNEISLEEYAVMVSSHQRFKDLKVP